jgi:hypothetical protein
VLNDYSNTFKLALNSVFVSFLVSLRSSNKWMDVLRAEVIQYTGSSVKISVLFRNPNTEEVFVDIFTPSIDDLIRFGALSDKEELQWMRRSTPAIQPMMPTYTRTSFTVFTTEAPQMRFMAMNPDPWNQSYITKSEILDPTPKQEEPLFCLESSRKIEI